MNTSHSANNGSLSNTASAQHSPKFTARSGFQNFLKQSVDDYFRMTHQETRDSLQQYVKAVIILGWLATSYVLLVFYALTWWQAGLLSLSLGLAKAGVGFCVQHDGNHGAFSKHKFVNRLTGLTLDLVGGSSYVWHYKHNEFHHTHTNIVGHDDDINTGFLGRLAPTQRRFWFHRFQHIYLWFLYGFLTIKWQLVDDFVNVGRGKLGAHTIKRPRGLDLAIFIGGKAVFFSLAFLIPLCFHSPSHVVLTYLITSLMMGVVLATVFQCAHVVEETDFPLPNMTTGNIEKAWAVHQVETTADFARGSKIWNWYLGGLNFQIEHHLFPRISHIHYPAISRLVEEGCKIFGIPYHSYETFFGAIRSHYRFLKAMGRPV